MNWRSCTLPILAAALLCGASPSRAQQEQAVNRAALMGLAEKFVEKIGKNIKMADEYLSGLDAEDIRLQSYFEGMPDGEPLILQLTLTEGRKLSSKRLEFDQPVTGIKEGNDVMISLLDFVGIADFPIKIDPAAGRATGWFIRENQTFDLDVNKGKVAVQDRTYGIKTGDLIIDGGDILVKGQTLARWFGFGLKTNLQSQKLLVESSQEWPLQERMKRLQKQTATPSGIPRPKQPYSPPEYKAFSPPRADVSLSQAYRKSPGGSFSSSDYNVQTTGDITGHSAHSLISGNEENILNSIRLTFSKASDNQDLLGPLRASFYEFNDVRTVRVPLTGAAPQERGIRVTNKNPHLTYDTVTAIHGNAPPGWDVELYRGLQYLGGVTIGSDGTYLFEDVALYSGDNIFRIVHYGPQGQIREEEEIYTVAPVISTAGNGLYDVSLSQTNTQTYTAASSRDKDKGSPHLAGIYEKQVADNLLLRGGVQARQQNDQQDVYLYSGLVSVLDHTLYNADLVTSTEGPFQAVVTGRRRLGQHNLTGIAKYSSKDFSSHAIEEDRVGRIAAYYSAGARAKGPFLPAVFKGMSYELSASALRNDYGTLQTDTGVALTSRVDRFIFGNSMNYHTQTGRRGDLPDRETLSGESSVRGYLWGTRWDTRLSYNIAPQLDPERYSLNLRRTLKKNLSGELDLRHDFFSDVTTGTVSANFLHDKATISPTVSYDSEDALQARMNVSFGLAMNPYTNDIVMSNTVLGSKGGVSAFVYLDKEGDGIFNNEDEPLQDVLVESVQNRRAASTDEKGEAFLYDLPTNKVTDIVMEENSAFDPTWVAGFAGISVRPRSGDTVRIDFPVLRGGEIDGTAYIRDDKGNTEAARNTTLRLVTPLGEVAKEVETPFDGFYVISAIRPGVYYMTVDTGLAPVTAYMVPRKIVVTTEGGILYGQDIHLAKGPDIPFAFRSTNRPPARRTNILKAEDIQSQETLLTLGHYRSRLAMGLAWYRFKLRTKPWSDHFTLAASLGDIVPDPATGLMPLTLRPRNPLSLEQGASVCQALIDKGFTCGVETVTTFRDPQGLSEATEKTKKNQKT